MPKATRPLSGAARDKYFRELFAAEPELPPAAADRLKRICTLEISQIRVREPLPDRSKVRKAAAPAPVVEKPAQVAEATTSTPQPAPPPAAADSTAESAPFDPYAFSLVTFFRRSGREALLSRLSTITSVDHLRQLAEAQHVAIPAEVTSPEDLRAAIIDGTEQRLADRRAAAS